MRALLLVLAVVLILALIGWISFSKGPERTSINLEKNKIREDTKQMMQSGAELLHKAGDKVESETTQVPANGQQAPVSR